MGNLFWLNLSWLYSRLYPRKVGNLARQTARKLDRMKSLASLRRRDEAAGSPDPEGADPERARKWILHFNLEHVQGAEEVEYGTEELLVVCLVRNGRPYVRSFVEHYSALGVRHIVFLDNGSTDGTADAARGHDNVTVLRTDLPFKSYQMAMKQYLIERFGTGRWTLCVDIDELFDYPFSDVLSLEDFLGYLNGRSFTAVVGQMLDMFSEKPLSDVEARDGDEPLKDVYGFYDISDVTWQRYRYSPFYGDSGNALADEEVRVFRGGIQKAVFGTLPLLTKHPLVFFDGEVRPMDGSAHAVGNARIADLSCVLYHYKFTSRLYEQVREAAVQENYMRDSRKHKKHLEVLDKTPSLVLKKDTAGELADVNELVNNGFLSISKEYVALLKDKQERLAEAFLDAVTEARRQRFLAEKSQRGLANQRRKVWEAERRNRNLQGREQRLQAQLQAIKTSKSWRLAAGLAGVRAVSVGLVKKALRRWRSRGY